MLDEAGELLRMPVVALGDRYTYCQSFGDVIRFLDLKVTLDPPLPPDGFTRPGY